MQRFTATAQTPPTRSGLEVELLVGKTMEAGDAFDALVIDDDLRLGIRSTSYYISRIDYILHTVSFVDNCCYSSQVNCYCIELDLIGSLDDLAGYHVIDSFDISSCCTFARVKKQEHNRNRSRNKD